ncbi:MAG TPA: hypothetical protein VF137_01700 [Candidatus Dormibacteraeota bacterium]
MPRTGTRRPRAAALVIDRRSVRPALTRLRRLIDKAESATLENKQLRAEVTRLQRELRAVQSALAGLAPGAGRRRASTASAPRRARRPITDPEVLERRRAALAKAREVRAQKRAAARGG